MLIGECLLDTCLLEVCLKAATIGDAFTFPVSFDCLLLLERIDPYMFVALLLSGRLSFVFFSGLTLGHLLRTTSFWSCKGPFSLRVNYSLENGCLKKVWLFGE